MAEEAGAGCFLIHFKNDGTSSLTFPGLHARWRLGVSTVAHGTPWIRVKCWKRGTERYEKVRNSHRFFGNESGNHSSRVTRNGPVDNTNRQPSLDRQPLMELKCSHGPDDTFRSFSAVLDTDVSATNVAFLWRSFRVCDGDRYDNE